MERGASTGAGLAAATLVTLLLVSITLTYAGFSSTTANPSNTFTASTCFQPVAVSISSFQFTVATVTIAAGCAVRWTNTANQKHTTSSDTGVWDSGQLNPNDTFTWTFGSAGSFPYKCKIHPSLMLGTVVVS